MEGRVPGYKAGDVLSPREQKFHQLLTNELKLSDDTADEIFRQGIDGFKVMQLYCC